MIPVKILLVDDLKDNLLALEGLLRRYHIEIFTAKSGVEALDLMIVHDFAVALIDVQMPIMNGFELAELMRGTKKTKEIPIIFVTATAKDRCFSFKGYDSGAVDFLLKPLDTHAVKNKVNIFVDLFWQKRELKNQLMEITESRREQDKLIAKLQRSQADLEVAIKTAEHANECKSTFLANMSHEIRTPLGAMLGFADLLRQPDLSESDRTRFIDVLTQNCENLSLIINDILDLSKIEAGHLKLEFLETSPERVISEVITLFAERAKEKELCLDYEIDLSTPKFIVSDTTRVRQILINLVGNAIKFTQTGSIRLRCCGSKSDSGRNIVCFEVHDTGIGIPDSQKENIFELFVQADRSTTRRFGGTGLGLALSRTLARSLGGDIHVSRTSLNVGSTFLLHIEDLHEKRNKEIAKVTTEAQSFDVPDDNALNGVKVMAVDDSPDNRFLISHYLTKYGANVELAENGKIACQKALDGDFDIIVMDIEMPEMDGYTATSQLRAAGYHKPIIALTAHAMIEVRQKCLNAGYTSYLTKPINAQHLVAMVATSLR